MWGKGGNTYEIMSFNYYIGKSFNNDTDSPPNTRAILPGVLCRFNFVNFSLSLQHYKIYCK